MWSHREITSTINRDSIASQLLKLDLLYREKNNKSTLQQIFFLRSTLYYSGHKIVVDAVHFLPFLIIPVADRGIAVRRNGDRCDRFYRAFRSLFPQCAHAAHRAGASDHGFSL